MVMHLDGWITTKRRLALSEIGTVRDEELVRATRYREWDVPSIQRVNDLLKEGVVLSDAMRRVDAERCNCS